MASEVRRICKAVLNGTTDIVSASNRLKECSSGGRRESLSLSVSCTLFALWDLCGEGDEAGQKRLALLARALLEMGILDEDVWLSTAEWDLIDASETVASVPDDKRREVRFYTRVVYVQTRYNLFSECPTGYARLFTLCQKAASTPVEELKSALCHLVGESKIEPHRVADALIEFLPPTPHASHKIMKLFDPHKTAHLMGRKLKSDLSSEVVDVDIDRPPEKLQRTTRVGRGDDLRLAKEHSVTSRSQDQRKSHRYFRLCAALAVDGSLDIQIVLRYLSPTLKESQERTHTFLKAVRKSTHEQRVPNLDRPLPEHRSRTMEKDKDVHSVYRDPKKFSYQPPNLREIEAEAVTTDDPILRLAAGFLETAQPGRALRILPLFEDVFCTEVTDGMLSVVDRVIDPFYRRIPSAARSMDRFFEDVKSAQFPSIRLASPMVFEWLSALGYRLHLKMDLFHKAVLVMLHELRFYGHPDYSNAACGSYPTPRRHSVEYMISTVILPSLLLMDTKQGIEAAVWIDGLVKMCSYSVQIMLFMHFEEVAAKSAILDRCVAMAETATRHLIKILVSAKNSEAFETIVLPIVDAFGKIAVRAPFHVTNAIEQKVQTDVMAVKDLSTAMLFFTPLAFAAFGYHIVVETISNGVVKKHDDGHLSSWYRNVLTLLGHVAHDHPDMLPLHFIFQNVLKEISIGEVIYVHVLRELVHSMTGFQHCSEIGNNQFATLSGGPMLKSIGLRTPWQRDEVGYNASTVALKRILASPPRNEQSSEDGMTLKLGGLMFVLLMKFLDFVPIRGDFAEATSIMDMHSVVLGTFLAFVEFLSVYCTAQEFSEMLPPMGYVLNDLRLPTHYVAHLYRPTISELRVVQGATKTLPTPDRSDSIQLLRSLIHRLRAHTTSNDVEMTDANSPSLQMGPFLKFLQRSTVTNLDPALCQSRPLPKALLN